MDTHYNKERYTNPAKLLFFTISLSLIFFTFNPPAYAKEKTITLIHLSDVHGHMVPHDEHFPIAGNRTNAGGVARLATAIKEIREDVGEENSLLFMVGDATHGGAEVLFTLGNAIMPTFNALRIDGFVMGNWDFAYGPRVTRNRYRESQKGKVKLSVNNQTTLSSTIPGCTGTAGPEDCMVIAANFDTVANNLYNFNEASTGAARKPNLDPSNRVLEPWVIKEANGIKVGFVGITSTRLSVQNPLFNLSFRFSKGYNELPQDIADAKAAGADIIVLATELGLSDNIQVAKEIPGIDVILSGDSHEAIRDPMLIDNLIDNDHQTIIVESGEDSYLGRLELLVDNDKDKIKNFKFELIEITDEIPEDTSDYFVPGGIKGLVTEARKTFVDGPEFKCHTFGNGGHPFGSGHTLCTPLDEVVGTTYVDLERHDVIGDVMNNFIADAFLDLAISTEYILSNGEPASENNTLGMANGFRYDIPVLGKNTPLDGPDGGVASGDITVGSLYNYFPIAIATSFMEYPAGHLRGSYENFLEGIFDPNPFRHRGGWWMAWSRNMHFVLDLEDAPTSVPLSTLGGRIVDMTINGNKWDPSSIKAVVSCYPHGDATDRQCRVSGGRHIKFPCGEFNPDLDTPSIFDICEPVNSEKVVDPTRSPVVLQVAPSNYLMPVQIFREYLKTHTITEAQFGPARRSTTVIPYKGCPDTPPEQDKDCDGVPDSDLTEVQPVQGAGPSWLGRGLIEDNDD